jgi:riboflavin kinase/FMN adenylyltransferase
VLTFSPHPIQLLRPGKLPPPLTCLDRKLELLEAVGVDVCVTYPTTPELLELSPKSFFDTIIEEQLAAQAIVEGPNFYFGRDRSGDVQTLADLCRLAKMRLHIVEPNLNSGDYISSSRIRQAITDGDVRLASRMLDYEYQIRGVVVAGARRGSTIGFPTANLEHVETLIPPHGVYAGKAVSDNVTYPAAIHIGPNPTFEDERLKLEVHLLDYAGNLYNKPLRVDFTERLRDVFAFDSVEDLVAQLNRDMASARKIFSES